MNCSLVSLMLILSIFCHNGLNALITDESQAEQYLRDVNAKVAEEVRKFGEVEWQYSTNITDQTSQALMNANKAFNDFQKRQSAETKKYDWTDFEDNNRRQFESLAVIGTAALDKKDEDEFVKVSSLMEKTYSSAKTCVSTRGCDLELEPDLKDIISHSTNYSELIEAWKNWRDVSGKPIRDKYIRYFTLGNKAAKMNELPNKKFNTMDDLWMHVWETDDLKEQTERLWQQLRPFYQKLHAYLRTKLKKEYGKHMPSDGTIPAHLSGNMWAQDWSSTMNNVKGVDPYPELATIDVSDALKEQKYTPKKMFELSDKFFTDLGLDKMTKTFWKKSLIEKPEDRTVVCHASASDFMTDDDFRIKQCTSVQMEDLVVIHHEMGHIQYFMQYKHQPTLFRDGANPGFHEAIGDLLALSVSTPKHLHKIGLLKGEIDPDDLAKITIKYQLKMALTKFMFLPFGYIMDKWRWDLFSGKVPPEEMNRHWWRLRGEYQGLSPPVNRSENDFDPGAKYHIPASVEYIRYFVSHILQFQFHKALCSYGQKDVPLHECDIDGDKEAGMALKQMMQKGSSEPWPQQLEALTGTKDMDVQPLLDYFKPLDQFLTKELKRVKKGWTFNVDKYFTEDEKVEQQEQEEEQEEE